MNRRALVSLLGILALAVGLLLASLFTGNRPLLGLDLKGGVEVVLVPVDDPERPEVTNEELEVAVDIIRDRIDSLGVAEPDVTRQGGSVVVQLPGISDQQRAIDLVGQTAELRFRPVCDQLRPEALPHVVAVSDAEPVAEDAGEGEDEGEAEQGPAPEEDEVEQTPAGEEEEQADTEPAPEESEGDTGPVVEDAGEGEGEAEQGPTPEEESEAQVEDDAEPAAEEAEEEDDAEAEQEPAPAEITLPAPELPVPILDERGMAGCPELMPAEALALETTDRSEDNIDTYVVLPGRDTDGTSPPRYLLGPTSLTGAGLSSAERSFTGEFVVTASFKGGDEGADAFDEIAFECFNGTNFCPSGRLAIVVDGTVQSAPTVQAAAFGGDVFISGGSGGFTSQEASDLALVLRYGALPVEFQDPIDPQSDSTSRAVSASIGEDSLDAGILAGIIGLSLVALFMILVYRLMGLVAITSLAVSATLLWVIVAWLGETQDLALTLAGVTGLIVSIGVSLDSNVVYFEHIKEDVASGRTLRSSLEQSFPAAFRTIFWANFASLIAAVILYWLSAGSVRGFALMLGLASLLDLVATYFFMRPCAQMLSRSNRLMHRSGLLGLPSVPLPVAGTDTTGSSS